MKNKQTTLLLFFFMFFVVLSLFIAGRLISMKDENSKAPIVEGVIVQEVEAVTVHSNPSRNAHVVMVVGSEELVEVLDSVEAESLKWYQVKNDEAEGWLLAEFLTIVESDDYQPME